MKTNRLLPSARDINRLEVLKVIQAEKLLSRSELAEAVSVSRTTVSGIVSELLRVGLLEEVGEGESTGGRRPIKLCYHPESRKAVGVVLFSERIQAVLTDMEGEPIKYLEIPLEGNTPDAMLEAMCKAAGQLIDGVPCSEVLGIGIGAPGVVNLQSGEIEISVSKGWLEKTVPVKEYLEEKLHFPVYVANRSRVAALGEQRVGGGRAVSDLIYIFLGQGIVAGIMLDGNLYLGSDYGAGEIGHISVDPQGPLCNCGNRGCLEIYASEEGILAKARAVARENTTSLLQLSVDGRLEKLSIELVIDAVRSGDPLARGVFSEVGSRLGLAVASLVNLLNPEMVVIGGPIGASAGDLLLEPVIREAQLRSLPRSFRKTKIVTGTLGTRAIAIGAAVLAIDHTPVNHIFGTPPDNYGGE